MKEYGFLDGTLLVNGLPIEGYDEGDDTISIARTQDTATHKVGTDGEMSVSLSANRSGTCTFRLMQTSDSNTYLSGLMIAQENSVFVTVYFAYTNATDGSGASGTSGYLTKPANIVRGEKVNSQTWMITVERLDMVHGTAVG